MSEYEKLRKGTKSDLIKCLSISKDQFEEEAQADFDCTIFDGAVLVHTLPVGPVSTFEDYAEKVFLGFLQRELEKVRRIDVVWDRYLPRSIKESTREKRGSGVRRKVCPKTKIPAKWMDFLKDSRNKEELFLYLSQCVSNKDWHEEKQIYITSDTKVINRGSGQAMPECMHEEADTRILVHLQHALQAGFRRIRVRTVDTDILVILIGHFFTLLHDFPTLDLWLALGVGKDFCHVSVNEVSLSLGETKARSLPAFHAFSGCDTTSCFFRRGKKSAWQAWQSYPEASEAFLYIFTNPFTLANAEVSLFKQVERLTVIMYDRTSIHDKVNEARRELFSKKAKSLENIPPTQVNCTHLC